MSEDVGIPWARDANGQRFTRWDIDRQPQPFVRPLRCGGCSMPVQPVRGYPQQRGSRIAQVSPHYRLLKQGQHEDCCPFDFDQRAAEIVEQSRGTVEKRQGSYRLLIPEDEAPVGNVDAGRTVSQPRTKLVIKPSRQVLLGETLSSAARIARLLRSFDHDPDTVTRFCAVYGDTAIGWRDFYVTPDGLTRAADRLDGGHTHPLVIHGVVHHRGTSAKGDSYFVSHRTGQSRTVQGQLRTLTITLRTREPWIYDRLTDGAPFLGFGRWAVFAADRSRYVEVRLWANAQWNFTTDVHTPTDAATQSHGVMT